MSTHLKTYTPTPTFPDSLQKTINKSSLTNKDFRRGFKFLRTSRKGHTGLGMTCDLTLKGHLAPFFSDHVRQALGERGSLLRPRRSCGPDDM